VGALDNKVAIITGGGSGIGADTAALFVQQGAKVLVVGRTEDKLRKVVETINHENVSYTVADVSRAEHAQRYVREAVERYGGLDILVSNAGTEGPIKPIIEYSVESFDQLMASNVRGVWLSCKYAFPELQKRGGGSIILTSSMLGLVGSAPIAPYIASKHAVVGLARALALEGAPLGIRVNAACPGFIDNDMMGSVHRQMGAGDEAQMQRLFSARVPLKRYGTNEESAQLNLFLASSQSSYVTGGAYLADGGVVAGIL
jgi:NAD(P)-dependent dehydrogenase (short-subunit alcohol dehydrogenase family)